MRKIPSLFKREPVGKRLCYNEITPGCEWVLVGEGVPMEKYDGTCCAIIGGKLYKRYDAARCKEAPPGFIEASPRDEHHWLGWLPVDPGAPSDRWHREAWAKLISAERASESYSTCELVGPKVQNNPYGLDSHELWPHQRSYLSLCAMQRNEPLTFDSLKDFLEGEDIEGIVWHHPDGQMAKVKRRDFGFEWPIKEAS